jgi:2-dehydro-3-deoxyphosphogluconate aldolase/(4S)-4-hydroxy-2-oxoglutarate aldolase
MTGQRSIADIMRLAPVIPVLVVDDAHDARPIAESLVAGGLRVLEVTLRTPAALEAVREMAQVEGAVVGCGTVLNEAHVDAAAAAGAEFLVSPGLTHSVAKAAARSRLPFLPGVATPTEIMSGFDLGLSHFKFFPAEASGGISGLQALGGPFADARFCPTGGITEQTAQDWLALPQVLCVGGTWLVPQGPIDLHAIRAAAERASSLAQST